MNGQARRTTPLTMASEKAREGSGIISGFLMLLYAVFALSVGAGQARANIDPAARGLAVSGKAQTQSLQSLVLARIMPALAPTSAAPTVTFSTSAMTSAHTFFGWTGVGGAPNPVFGIYGAAQLTLRNTINPQFNIVSAAPSSASTSGSTEMTVSFYHYGTSLDLIQYGSAHAVSLWIDDVFVGRYAPAFATGAAQAGGSNTITLAAGASATNGFYNQYYARITGGTGAGQIQQITGYVGATKVATVAANWTTQPDGTSPSTYSIEESPGGIALDGITGSVKYLNLSWASAAIRKITVVQGDWMGVNIGPNDAIWPGPPVGEMPLLVVGDSFWEGTAAPLAAPTLLHQTGRLLGMQPYNLSSGGTGWANRNAALQRLTFADRIAPPAESWRLANTATGGTYTISVTSGGSTQTTGALAYNATAATVETALNGLSNVTGATFSVARGDFGAPLVVIGHNIAGATLSVSSASLTGGALSASNYPGDVALNVPKDASGNALPFVLLVPGSGNDSGFSDAQVQAVVSATAAQIVAKFPTAIPVFTGVVSVQAGSGNGVVNALDVSRNAAISTGAQSLPKAATRAAYVETFPNGLGSSAVIYGAGNVSAPTANTTDIMKSVTVTGHPTGVGAGVLAAFLAQRVKALFGSIG